MTSNTAENSRTDDLELLLLDGIHHFTSKWCLFLQFQGLNGSYLLWSWHDFLRIICDCACGRWLVENISRLVVMWSVAHSRLNEIVLLMSSYRI